MDRLSQNETLESFRNLLPYLPTLFEEDISFGITDKENYLIVQNCERLPINAKGGDKIPSGGAALEALKTGRTIIKDVPKQVYGVAFKSYAIPVKDAKQNVVGVLLAGKSLEKRQDVLGITQTLASSLQQISASIQEISAGAQSVVHSNIEIQENVKTANESAQNTDDILKLIQNVSSQTNLLGLNASIEAARAGEFGRGFDVVAQEIRKLSNSSSESVRKVDDILKRISQSVRSISDKLDVSTSFFEAQASAIEEISASIEELTNTASQLEKLAETF